MWRWPLPRAEEQRERKCTRRQKKCTETNPAEHWAVPYRESRMREDDFEMETQFKENCFEWFCRLSGYSYTAITAGPVSLGRICTLQACCASPSCNFLKFGTRKYHFSWHMDESVLDTEINWIQLNKEIWIWVFTFTRPELVLVKMHTLRFY